MFSPHKSDNFDINESNQSLLVLALLCLSFESYLMQCDAHFINYSSQKQGCALRQGYTVAGRLLASLGFSLPTKDQLETLWPHVNNRWKSWCHSFIYSQ